MPFCCVVLWGDVSESSIRAESGRSYTWDDSLLLGSGSSGVRVFAATDDQGRSLALKQVPLDQRSDSRWLIDHYRSEEEPRIGALLLQQRVKHVLPVFDWAKDDGALYLLMNK